VGAKGSSSIATPSEYDVSPFHTKWSEEQYFERMQALHFKATQGQRQGIITEILMAEQGMLGKSNSNMDRAATEYEDTMQSIELYENLVEEGKGK